MSDRITTAFPVEFGAKQAGMDLRDYFAAAALQGILAGRSEHYPLTENALRGCAGMAYQLADLMMERREK